MGGKSEFDWHSLLPAYLLDYQKERLSRALGQFQGSDSENTEIDYSDFYLFNPPQTLLQGDLMLSVPRPIWNIERQIFETFFSRGLLISNSCDVALDNKRTIQKDAVFAPIIPLSEFEKDLIEKDFNRQKIESIFKQLKNQLYSNILYLPSPERAHNGFIVYLDQLFSLPNEEIVFLQKDLTKHRYQTLDNFGSYLMIVKLSFHFCRVPEEVERRS